MSRPRIRTLKPELAQDDDLGALSRDVRYTFIGLITMADDEGRLRAKPTIIIGHWFPYDDDISARKLAGWLGQLEECGRILCYEHERKPYIAIRHFRRHQQINKPNPSKLPPPPDANVVRDNEIFPSKTGALPDRSRSAPGALPDRSRSTTSPRARTVERNGTGTEEARVQA